MSHAATAAEAILIFEGKQLVREMLYSEFEAVLDGFVPLPEQAKQQVTAVYLRLAAGYHVKAAVFFLIAFDAEGYPDRRWNVPLEQLADTAAAGPDMGAGAIRLACRSQCPIAWHQQQLWDPQMTADSNHLALIKRAIRRNRLGLDLAETPAPPTLSRPLPSAAARVDDEAWRRKLAQAIKEQRLRVSTLQAQHQQQLEALKAHYLAAAQQDLQQIEQLGRELETARRQRTELEAELERQTRKVQGLREYFEHKLSALKNVDAASLTSLKSHLEQEKTAEIEALSRSFGERLQMREIELMYRDTQLAGLQEEIEKLQAEKQELLNSSGNSLLSQMSRAGISFVTFQPGAGHMTIPVGDMADFMADPDRYTARICQVDEALFDRWREHYNCPECTHEDSQGNCQRPLERVERPAEFLPGESDRCPEHRVADSGRRTA